MSLKSNADSEMCAGVSVSVVLKADQRSGRLTSGSISEVDFAYSAPLYELEDVSQKQKAPCTSSSCLIARFSPRRTVADSEIPCRY